MAEEIPCPKPWKRCYGSRAAAKDGRVGGAKYLVPYECECTRDGVRQWHLGSSASIKRYKKRVKAKRAAIEAAKASKPKL